MVLGFIATMSNADVGRRVDVKGQDTNRAQLPWAAVQLRLGAGISAKAAANQCHQRGSHWLKIYIFGTQGVTSCVAEACPAVTDGVAYGPRDRLCIAQQQVGAHICVPHCCHMVEVGRLRQAAKHWCCVFVNSTIYCCHSTGTVPVDAGTRWLVGAATVQHGHHAA